MRASMAGRSARVCGELDAAEPGMTTRELDALGERLLERHGARSAPRLVYDFPGATCISIDEEAAHGVPGDRVIRPGDVLNVDVSAEPGGCFADTGGTRVVPPTDARKSVPGYHDPADRRVLTEVNRSRVVTETPAAASSVRASSGRDASVRERHRCAPPEPPAPRAIR